MDWISNKRRVDDAHIISSLRYSISTHSTNFQKQHKYQYEKRQDLGPKKCMW